MPSRLTSTLVKDALAASSLMSCQMCRPFFFASRRFFRTAAQRLSKTTTKIWNSRLRLKYLSTYGIRSPHCGFSPVWPMNKPCALCPGQTTWLRRQSIAQVVVGPEDVVAGSPYLIVVCKAKGANFCPVLESESERACEFKTALSACLLSKIHIVRDGHAFFPQVGHCRHFGIASTSPYP